MTQVVLTMRMMRTTMVPFGAGLLMMAAVLGGCDESGSEAAGDGVQLAPANTPPATNMPPATNAPPATNMPPATTTPPATTATPDGTAGTGSMTPEIEETPDVIEETDDVEVPDAVDEVPDNSGETACLDGITDFNADGPFSFQEARAGSVKLWVPDIPAGCKVPVLHLANGTGGSCSSYQNVLDHFASHGFLTTCYESGQTGAGTQGVEAITAAFDMYPDIAATRIGSTGHSQGGQAAFTVLQQSEAKWGDSYLYAGLAMQPASGFGAQPPGMSWQAMYEMIYSPMFMFSGTSDSLVSESWVSRGFAALNDTVEAYNWSARGATHIPTPQEETMEVGVPWFRWKLLGDTNACEAFKALEGNGRWTSEEQQNVQDC